MNASFRAILPVLGVAAAGLVAAGSALSAPEPADRVTRSAEGFATDRDAQALRDPRTLEESRVERERLVRQPRQPKSSGTLSAAFTEAWIYDATVELFYDDDRDGYYRYLRVRFDADTTDRSLWVYAALFLSADGETWEEYYVTDDFLIRGTSPNDDYEVETELVAGYPPGQYDLLIELYDADYSLLLDEFGPLESASLALLPLEDAEHDLPPPISGGGGASGWPLLALLAAAVVRRRSSRPVRATR